MYIHIYIYLSICLSIYLSIYPSRCLSRVNIIIILVAPSSRGRRARRFPLQSCAPRRRLPFPLLYGVWQTQRGLSLSLSLSLSPSRSRALSLIFFFIYLISSYRISHTIGLTRSSSSPHRHREIVEPDGSLSSHVHLAAAERRAELRDVVEQRGRKLDAAHLDPAREYIHM